MLVFKIKLWIRILMPAPWLFNWKGLLIMKTLMALLICCLMSSNLHAQTSQDDRMQWWRDAKFGMFIHWGVYAVHEGMYKGESYEGTGEWAMNGFRISVKEYEAYAKQFNPVKFNAEQWVLMAKDAGMKYIVITAKHHEGFSLWPSQYTDYDIEDFTQFKRDPIQELADASKKHGIKFGLYYSIIDWHHPQAQAYFEPDYNGRASVETSPEFQKYIDNYMKPQLKELVEKYDPAILWFDGDWVADWTEPRGKDLYKFIRQLKPSILVNNRVDKGRNGMQGLTKAGNYAGDFGTPEQQVPTEGLPGVDWEACITMNDTWGFKRQDANWKSADQLIHLLKETSSKGGNLLLNVGPTKEGLIPPESVARLKAIGQWVREVGFHKN